MRHLILLISLFWAMFSSAQINFKAGYLHANALPDNPINLQELRTWDGYTPGVRMGSWATPEQIAEFQKRSDASLEGVNFGVGYDLTLIEYRQQRVESSAGLSFNVDVFYQGQRDKIETFQFKPSVGAFVDFGLRFEVGMMQYYKSDINYYIDVSARIVNQRDFKLYLYTKYQRSNPYTDSIPGHDLTASQQIGGVSLETVTAGLRFKF